MEPFADGWMGNCSKPDSRNYHHCGKVEKAGLCFFTGNLQSTKTRKGFVSCDLANRPVRDPYAGWCERCSGGLSGSPAIYSISRSVFIFSVIFLSICYFVSVCRALEQTHSLTSFGFSIGSCGLAMCVAVKRGHLFLLLFCRISSY